MLLLFLLNKRSLLIGFTCYNLSNGHFYRLLNVINDDHREGFAIEADFSLLARPVIRVLEKLLESRDAPISIVK